MGEVGNMILILNYDFIQWRIQLLNNWGVEWMKDNNLNQLNCLFILCDW